ncbi:hypothetical protein C1H84_14220 [Glutamicibacter soli]|uniref:Lipoprotein n=2 Tax=Glutamicibacter soli TaxID=453836 RepID=A0A365YA60_9MICC|nr:hypothetical protein C1H84_14220 [Glutamicibacter soli]
MKKIAMSVAAAVAALVLAGCGVSTEEHEAVQASAAAVTVEKQELETQLADTTTKLTAAQAEAEELRSANDEREVAEKAEADKKANKAKKITSRELAQIVKKPDSYLDKNVIIYARVTQFDSATGPCTFRANVSHAQVGKYDYEHNTIFNAGDGLTNCDILDDVVAEDIVKVTATVTGSLTYDTQVGGSTTVPEMQVVKITRL